MVRDQAQVIRLGNKLVYPLAYPLRHTVSPKGFFVGFFVLLCFMFVCLFIFLHLFVYGWCSPCLSVCHVHALPSEVRGGHRIFWDSLTTKAVSCFMGAGTRTSERAGCTSNYLSLQPPFSVLKIISLIAVIGFIPVPGPVSVSLVTPASKTFREPGCTVLPGESSVT